MQGAGRCTDACPRQCIVRREAGWRNAGQGDAEGQDQSEETHWETSLAGGHDCPDRELLYLHTFSVAVMAITKTRISNPNGQKIICS